MIAFVALGPAAGDLLRPFARLLHFLDPRPPGWPDGHGLSVARARRSAEPRRATRARLKPEIDMESGGHWRFAKDPSDAVDVRLL
jgi:hypothetical protein